MDELSLVAASQAGNRVAFDSLINRYYKDIYRLAYQHTGSHHEADDLCQETFLRAFDAIRDLRDASCFRAWIFMIASNLLRKRMKEVKRRRKLALEASESTSVGLVENNNMEPLERLSAKEKAAIVHQRLQEMPEDMRLATILVLMQGLTQKEAAAALDCSEASVCRRLDMARQWLKAKLRNLV